MKPLFKNMVRYDKLISSRKISVQMQRVVVFYDKVDTPISILS